MKPPPYVVRHAEVGAALRAEEAQSVLEDVRAVVVGGLATVGLLTIVGLPIALVAGWLA